MLQIGLERIDAILAALEKTRPSVGAHSRRVADFSVRLAAQYGLAADEIETVRLGALLHDVGKLLVPARILAKPSRPNRREWRELKIHPEIGMEIAHRAGYGDDVCGIILYHHERWDGKGYPDGLRDRAIHWTIRIVSVMDAFDAITSPRHYRETLTVDAAKAVMARAAGTWFCPWVVSGLLSMPASLLVPPGVHALRRYAPESIAETPALESLAPWRAFVGREPGAEERAASATQPRA